MVSPRVRLCQNCTRAQAATCRPLLNGPTPVHSLAQGDKPGKLGISGTNDFGRVGYGGSCPPKGHGPHWYFFKLYSVSRASTGLKAGAKRSDLDRAVRGHVLAEVQYMGRYERR